MNEPVFDPSREIAVNLPRFNFSTTVRYPDFDDLVTHNGSIKVYQRAGQGKTEVEGQAEAASNLLSKIATEKSETMDPEAAQVAVSFLLFAEAEEPERDANIVRIPVTVMAGIRTVHALRMPTLKEERKWTSDVVWFGESKFKRFQVKFSYPAAGALYDTLITGVEGYGGDSKEKQLLNVPLNHKFTAVRALIDYVAAADQESTPLSFK